MIDLGATKPSNWTLVIIITVVGTFKTLTTLLLKNIYNYTSVVQNMPQRWQYSYTLPSPVASDIFNSAKLENMLRGKHHERPEKHGIFVFYDSITAPGTCLQIKNITLCKVL